jgi:DNA-binding transcriptional LysR family regulator
LEWQQLQYFKTVAHLQNVSRASEELNISQSALSRAISNLEDDLGVPLFDRRGRSLQLNRYGRTFLKRVESALHEVEEGRRELEDLVGPIRGTVCLGFLHTLGAQLIPDLLKQFRKIHPSITFQLIQNDSTTMIQQLRSGEMDLCLLSPPLRSPGIGWIDLKKEELYLIVPPDHLLSKRQSIRLAEAADESFISVKKGTGLRRITDTLCTMAGFSPNVTFEGDEVNTVCGLVSAGLGVALIPDNPTINATSSASVVYLRVEEPRCERIIGVTWMEDRYLSAASKLFQQFLVEYFSQLNEPKHV